MGGMFLGALTVFIALAFAWAVRQTARRVRAEESVRRHQAWEASPDGLAWAEKQHKARQERYVEMAGYLCAKCLKPITCFSDENDYICDPCGGFVNVVRPSDGALIAGDGFIGVPRVIGRRSVTES